MAKTNKKEQVKTIIAKPFARSEFFYEALVFLFAFFLFANSITNGYNLDDELVTRDHRLTSKGIAAIPDIFTSPYYQDASGYSYEYRPVVLVSFAIEHQIFEDNAHVSHFINILLYSLACVILFMVLRLLFKEYSVFLSLGISILFAAHPAHTEVVCSIKNRDEILSLLLGLSAMLVAVKAIRKRSPILVFAVGLLFTLALMSKVTIVSFALIIPFALILFSDIDIRWLVSLTLLLILPAFILLNLNGGIARVQMAIGIMGIVLIVYALFHGTVSSVKTRLLNFYQQPVETKDETAEEYDFRNIISRSIPDKNVWVLKAALVPVLLATFYVFALWTGYFMLACIPMGILLFLTWRGPGSLSWWSSVMIGIAFAASACINSASYQNEWYTQFLCLYLVYQMIYGKRGLLIPYLFCFIIINYISITVWTDFNGLFALTMLLLAFTYTRIAILILIISVNVLQIYRGIETPLNVMNLLVIGSIAFSIHFKRWMKEMAPVLGVLTFIAFQVFQTQGISTISLHGASSAINTQVNPTIIKSPQNRPLTYIEECVPMNAPVTTRVGTSLEILLHYLYKVAIPYPMAFYYGYRFIHPQNTTEPLPLLSLVLYILLWAAGFILLRKNKMVSFGIFLYLISISVFSNYFQPVPGMLADRFLLIPSLGWCIVVWVLVLLAFKADLASKSQTLSSLPRGASYVFAAMLILYSGITFSRNMDWKDDLTLFRHDISYVSQSAQAHNLLALHLMQHSVTEPDNARKIELEKEALAHFIKAQDIYPYFFNIAYDIGRVYTYLNMPDSAIKAFKYSLTLDSALSDDYLSLATLLMSQSKYEEAIPYLRSAIRIIPNDYIGYDKLSFAYFQLHRYDESISVNLQAADKVGKNPDPLINIGRAYIEAKKPDSARIYLNKANEIMPGNVAVQQLLQQTAK